MPVRSIPPSRRAITGRLAARKNRGPAHYESALERDFLMTLEADPAVLSYEIQPMRLNYQDLLGRKRHYTPDVLVVREHGTELCEVKYSSDIRMLRAEHKERWLAARHYAIQQGWTFRLITEHHTRHPRSANWLFLSPFRQPFPQSILNQVLDAVSASPTLTVRDWLHRLPEPQTQWISAIWHLIATEKAVTDMNVRLSLDSVVYVVSLSLERHPGRLE